MSLPTFLTPARRDALLVVLTFTLLLAPVWAPMFHFNDPTHRYERVHVTTANGTIEYANESGVPVQTVISAEIACTESFMKSRSCFFERYLAEGHTISSGIWSTNPGHTIRPSFYQYRYALVNGTVYKPSYDTNESKRNQDGLYRVELALEPEPTDKVLRRVSVDADRTPDPIRKAAENGAATSHREIEVPETPIRLDDGTYYRVYDAGETDPSELDRLLAGLLRYGLPYLGIGLVVYISGKFEIRHVGDEGTV